MTGSTRTDRWKRHPEKFSGDVTLRDIEIISSVYKHRFLNTDQVHMLHFLGGNKSQCVRRLQKLYHLGYVDRIRDVLVENGSRPIVYTLARRGAELALLTDWEPDKIKPMFLQHTLKVNDLRILISLMTTQLEGQLEVWHDERELWRMMHNDKVVIETQETTLNPDAYFVLYMPQREGIAIRGFLEIDMGTESNAKVWTKKVLSYLEYHEKHFKNRFGARNMRVFTVTTSERRLENLKKCTEVVGGQYRFWFTTFKRIAEQNILTASIWSMAMSETLHAMTE